MSSRESGSHAKFGSCQPMPLRIAVGERTWRQLERRPGRTRRKKSGPCMTLLFVGACVVMSLALALPVGLLGAMWATLCVGAWWVR